MMVWIVCFLYRIFFATVKNPISLNFNFNIITDMTGIILISISDILLLLSFISFGKSWRIGIDKNKPGELITEGIFSISRNPVFLAFDFIFAGIAFLFPSYELIGLGLLCGYLLQIQILNEEQFLKQLYGEKYETYFKQTRRYIGRRIVE